MLGRQQEMRPSYTALKYVIAVIINHPWRMEGGRFCIETSAGALEINTPRALLGQFVCLREELRGWETTFNECCGVKNPHRVGLLFPEIHSRSLRAQTTAHGTIIYLYVWPRQWRRGLQHRQKERSEDHPRPERNRTVANHLHSVITDCLP